MSRVRLEWLLCGALMLSQGAMASMGHPKKPTDERQGQDIEALPESELAFLEYLGTLVRDGDTWVGPDDMPAEVGEFDAPPEGRSP